MPPSRRENDWQREQEVPKLEVGIGMSPEVGRDSKEERGDGSFPSSAALLAFSIGCCSPVILSPRDPEWLE